jgi:subfamily B ATP-binding cassette protein MsbA
MKQVELARRFWPYVIRYRGHMLEGVGLMVLMVLMDLAQPLPLKILFDYVFGSQPLPPILQPVYAAIGGQRFNLLLLVGALAVGIAATDATVSYLGQSRVTNLGQRVVFNMRRDLYAHLQALPLSFHDKRRTGDMVARLTSDLVLVQNLVVSGLFDLFTNSLTLTGMVVIMFLIDWRLTLLALTVMPPMFFVVHHYPTKIRMLSRDQRKKEGQIASISQETLSSQRIVKAYNAEDGEISRFEQASAQSLASSMASTRLQSAFTGVVAVCVSIGTGAIILVGGTGVMTAAFTAGDLIVFLTYLGSMYRPMRNLSKLANTITKATAAAERIVEILDTSSDITDAPDALELPEIKGRIEFDHVDFGYVPSHLVLSDISMRVEPGEKVAIVGSTGAGKTTMMSLLLRFYDPKAGSIRVDGLDLRRVRLASLRRQIGIVLQEAVLFHMTVRENIAYGRPDSGLGEVIAAAEAAQAHDFVSRLPEGYGTVVGERGVTLSGGERQRIAIARAILKDAPIVVLDEPTTGLDAQSEDLVMRALDELTRGKTTFLITHRLATIRDADRIYVVEDGRIVESGTHEDLLKLGGRYSELYGIQSRRAIGSMPEQPGPPNRAGGSV